jgi:hypothetical protein
MTTTKKTDDMVKKTDEPKTDPAPEQPDEDAAPTGLQLGDLGHCPTPWVCFPYLPADASHAACVHGETHASS